MASTFTTRLQLERQATGENDSSWGTKLNAVLDDIDLAIAGVLSKSVAGSSDVTLTDDEALEFVQVYSGALTANINVIVPTREKAWLVVNSTSGNFTLTVKTSGGTGITVTQGQQAILYCDGTNVEKIIASDDEELVNDTTPQLGGDLDANGNNVQFDDATGLQDDSGNEQVVLNKTASAVNHVGLTNAATGNDPLVAAEGDDTDVGLLLKGQGAGQVKLGDAELAWPDSDGSNGQFLQTDGSGALSFASASSGGLESGTKLAGFQQTSAPTGWTKLTSQDDKALRVVSGTPGTGGATAFSSVFGSGKTTDGHTLTTSEIPTHNHSGTNLTISVGTSANAASGSGVSTIRSGGGQTSTPASVTGNTGDAGSGGSHSHGLSLDLQYVDIILCQKD